MADNTWEAEFDLMVRDFTEQGFMAKSEAGRRFKKLIADAEQRGAEKEVSDGLKYMNVEARDGLSGEELVKSCIRYWTNRAMDLEAARSLPDQHELT